MVILGNVGALVSVLCNLTLTLGLEVGNRVTLRHITPIRLTIYVANYFLTGDARLEFLRNSSIERAGQ